MALVSFDIDGTLEIGEPPGIVPVALVHRARRLGYVIGTCSDRPIAYQRNLWHRLRILPDFTVLKHHLSELKHRFQATAYYHIGDTETDAYYATAAGFHFLRADSYAHKTWSAALFADASDFAIDG